MAKMVAPLPLYAHPEWVQDNQIRYRATELERQAAERLTKDADRFEDETDKRTDKSLADVNKKLDQRADEIKYWGSELDKIGEKLHKETDMLKTDATRIDKARSAAKEYLHLAESCKQNREGRYGIDRCADNPHFNLIKEIDIYKNVLKLLDRTEEEANEQLRRNRKAKYQIDKDSLNKQAALAIDEYSRELKPNSKDIFDESQRKEDGNMIGLSDWIEMSNDNINRAENERANSEKMRAIIDGILQQIANDMEKQVHETNMAFKRRIDEVVDAKGKDEEHMNRVLQEIKDTEVSMEDLKVCLDKKIAYLELAKHRIGQRNQRPDQERVLDNPHIRLHEEICEIESDIANLKQRIIDHQFELKALRRRQLVLEEDIECKSNSIFVDQVICMGIRESLIVKSY